jgi:beta-glucosidase
LPLSRRDLRRGVVVIGAPAEYMPAEPGTEVSNRYYDRDAISPLEQLKKLVPRRSHITFLPYVPGSAPTIGDGMVVPQSGLSTNGKKIGNGLERMSGPGSPRIDPQIDFTHVSGRGQLAFGKTYTWTGYINVPASDDYTFRFQFSVPDITGATAPSCTGSGAPTFSFASTAGVGQSTSSETLTASGSTMNAIPTNPTMSGNTERALANCLYEAGSVSAGVHAIQISWTTPSSLGSDIDHLREPGSRLPSLRFALFAGQWRSGPRDRGGEVGGQGDRVPRLHVSG